METKEYKLLDGRTIRAKYNRLGRCNISKENLEEFVKEFNASYRQAKILEKIKENYALMKADERKKGKWVKEFKLITDGYTTVKKPIVTCSECSAENSSIYKNFCPNCGAETESENDSN